MPKVAEITALNRKAWNASAAHHGAGPAWEAVCEVVRSGGSTLDATVTDALREAGIEGAKLVQVGCNNGREVFSSLALGASEAWGIDQSEAFLDQAWQLTKLSPHQPDFLQADIYALPDKTPRNCDIVLITIGVLNWMPDLAGFFEAVASLLCRGGQIVIYETHPMLEMFDPDATDPFTPVFSYFRTRPHIETQSITYDGTSAQSTHAFQWFPHTLSAIVQAALDAGLTLDSLQEFAHSIREVDYDIYSDRAAQVPMSYLLRASKT